MFQDFQWLCRLCYIQVRIDYNKLFAFLFLAARMQQTQSHTKGRDIGIKAVLNPLNISVRNMQSIENPQGLEPAS